MAEAVVSLVVKLSCMAACDWIQSMHGLSDTIKQIVKELRSMDAFLKMYDGYELATNLTRENYIKDVRLMANQLEDVIDEYIFLRSERLQENGILPSARYLIMQIRNIGNRSSIAGRVELILPQFEEMRRRFDRYEIHPPNVSDVEIGSSSTLCASRSQLWHNPQDDALFNENLVGIEGPKAELIERIVRGAGKRVVVPVYGMGGLGKTTLVRKVYEDGEVKRCFGRYIWIDFTRNLKREDLFKALIEKHCQGSREQPPERLGTMTILDLKREIYKLLENDKYLVILDNVQALDKWLDCEKVFPKNDLGSRVVITTQDLDVARQSGDAIYYMNPLSHKDSLSLFRKKAFDGGHCPPHLSQLRNVILEKCGGMPLGIESIGSLLREKRQTVAEWSLVNDSLGNITNQDHQHLRSLDKILSRCYYDLSLDLKPCFLYMSIFPGDHPIEHLKLIRLWMAEGFVGPDGNKTAVDVAESYISQLLSRSLIQVAERRSDGRVKSYRIHGLMRETLISKSKALNFVARNTSISNSYNEVRRLSVQNSLVNLQERLRYLRSLLLFDVKTRIERLTMPVLFGKSRRSKLLTVLDLQGANVMEFPSAITNMLNLRYLNLRDTMVKEIPNSISRLQKLETLDLKRTKVTKLPSQIKHLRQLENLLLYRYDVDINGAFPSKHGFQAPAGITSLASLQKLCFIEAGKDSRNIVAELGELKRLRRLGIIKLSTKHERELWSSIQKMTQLRALSVTASEGETMDLQLLNSPPHCLERLYLTGALRSFPKWTESPSLQNLVKIFLKSSNLDKEPLGQLGNLKNLQHIELHQAYNGDRLSFRRGKFLKLKILGIRKSDFLETVTIEEHSMPNLEKFLIQECQRLKRLPLGIEWLSKLRVLDFVAMPEEVYTRIQGVDYGNIRHIPQVTFTTNVDKVWIMKRVSTDNTSATVRKDKQLVNEIKDFSTKC